MSSPRLPAIFAVFPALLYLIGKRLHSRTGGLALAGLIIFRGLTSLAASAWIDTATFKHMLTDFPTAIGVAAFLLRLLKWLEAPRERASYLIWAGGVLGLTSLLRPHVLLLMAAAMLLALWLLRAEFKRGVIVAALASLAFLMGVLPWMMLGPGSGSLIAQYGQRVQAVIAQRYPVLVPTAVARRPPRRPPSR